jgi:hypothetical protein
MGKRGRNRTRMGNTKKIWEREIENMKKETRNPESPPYFLGFYLNLLYLRKFFLPRWPDYLEKSWQHCSGELGSSLVYTVFHFPSREFI